MQKEMVTRCFGFFSRVQSWSWRCCVEHGEVFLGVEPLASPVKIPHRLSEFLVGYGGIDGGLYLTLIYRAPRDQLGSV